MVYWGEFTGLEIRFMHCRKVGLALGQTTLTERAGKREFPVIQSFLREETGIIRANHILQQTSGVVVKIHNKKHVSYKR